MMPENKIDFDKESRRVGHILGLSGEVTVKLGNMRTQVYEVEGECDTYCLEYVIEKLRSYPGVKNSGVWFLIEKTFREALEAIPEGTGCQDPEKLLDNYSKGKPTHVCAGWFQKKEDGHSVGHSVGVTLYKGYLIVCNRGKGGDINNGTCIYQLKEPIDINKIKGVTSAISNSKEVFLENFKQLQATPIAMFPQKGQKHGTCAYVNKLSSIEAMHCLFSLMREAEENHLIDFNKAQFIEQGLQKYAEKAKDKNNPDARKAYKDFTRYTRDSEVDRMIEKMNEYQAQGNENMLRYYIGLSYKVIDEHSGSKTKSNEKSVEEVFRAKKLFDAIESAITLLHKNRGNMDSANLIGWYLPIAIAREYSAKKIAIEGLYKEFNDNLVGLETLLSKIGIQISKIGIQSKIKTDGFGSISTPHLRLYYKDSNAHLITPLKSVLQDNGITFYERRKGNKQSIAIIPKSGGKPER